MLVVHVGHRHNGVRQAGVAVRADVQLQAEESLLALSGLMNFAVAPALVVLGRARRSRVKAFSCRFRLRRSLTNTFIAERLVDSAIRGTS